MTKHWDVTWTETHSQLFEAETKEEAEEQWRDSIHEDLETVDRCGGSLCAATLERIGPAEGYEEEDFEPCPECPYLGMVLPETCDLCTVGLNTLMGQKEN